MKQSPIIFTLIVLIAFVDGMLFMEHWMERDEEPAPEVSVAEPIQEKPTIVEEPAPLVVTWPDLPFTTQAPYGWTFPWTYYAEEAALVMALSDFQNPREAADQISALAAWMQVELGNTKDNSLEELQQVVRGYFNREAYIQENPGVVNLITELDQGAMILAPIHGPTMENPNYGNPAPEHHVVLIYGYTSEGFLAHDPGTVKGEAVTYEYEKILESLQDLNGSKQVLIIQPS